MENIAVILMLIAVLVGLYSIVSVIFPLKPFQTRKQAAKGFLWSVFVFVAAPVITIFIEANGPKGSVEDALASTASDDAPASCGDGGVVFSDIVSVTGQVDLHESPGGERLLNERMTAALKEKHYLNASNTGLIQRVCVQDDWTEVKLLAPESLKGTAGWVESEAIRTIEMDQNGVRIFVEDDFYWGDDVTAKFKPEIVSVVNRIVRENDKCDDINTGSVVLSHEESSPGQPVFSVSCNPYSTSFNVLFAPEDADSDAKFTAVQPIGRRGGADACEAAAKQSVNHPSTVSFSRLMDLAYDEHPSGRARVTSSFTAKNALGLKLRFQIVCLFEGGSMVETHISEDHR